MIFSQLEQFDAGWQSHFKSELSKPYLQQLDSFLENEVASGKEIYPPQAQRFNAFRYTPFDQVKVVIVGQDPYHGKGQAHGLSFSVPDGVKIPPSLRNIYKELSRDLGINIPDSGNLEKWARQGVLLLNASLTVREGEANSHSKQGWLQFTHATIELLNQNKNGIVFLAWGRFAHEVCSIVDSDRHLVIKTSHPSPLGATKSGKGFTAFMGSGCFSQANSYLSKQGVTPIDWSLDNDLFN